ncbi:hypothetical protein FACS189490_05230 [Clostridia bacterium]|nr:hypothetical protein FACS189490_05230 [Clostridia bacterium]
MNVFPIGLAIKQARESQNLTRKELCFGICNESTLLRIEKDESFPSSFTIESLIERLGLDLDKYVMLIKSPKEIELRNSFDEVEEFINIDLIDKADVLLKVIESKLSVIDSVSDKLASKTKIETQIAMHLRTAILQKQKADTNNIVELAKKALKFTLPDLREYSIPNSLLTYREIALLNILACSCAKLGNPQQAVDLLSDIKSNIESQYFKNDKKSIGYVLTLYNLSNLLTDVFDYEASIEICDLALMFCKKQNRFRLFPRIVFIKAYCLFYLEHSEDEYVDLMADAYQMSKYFEDFSSLKIMENFIKENDIAIRPQKSN